MRIIEAKSRCYYSIIQRPTLRVRAASLIMAAVEDVG